MTQLEEFGENISTKSNRKVGTSITFTADDLNALARYISAGMVFLQISHPVVTKIKAALTRMGLSTPKGL